MIQRAVCAFVDVAVECVVGEELVQLEWLESCAR